MSSHTTSTVYTDYAWDIHFGCPHSALLSCACEVAHLCMCVCHCSCILCVSQLSCFLVWKSARLVWMHKSTHVCSGRVQLFWQTGQLPPISHCKENIDIKWPNCATQRERGGTMTAISFPQRTTRVNCLAFCRLLWWKSREKRAEKQTKPSQRAWTATQKICASASRNGPELSRVSHSLLHKLSQCVSWNSTFLFHCCCIYKALPWLSKITEAKCVI